MEKTKLEMVVGVFVLVGILCLAYLSIKLGKLEMIGGDVYEVEAQFNSASGLKPGRRSKSPASKSAGSEGLRSSRIVRR